MAIPAVSSSGQPLRVGLVGVTGYGLAYFEALEKMAAEGQISWGAVTIINRREAAMKVAYFEEKGVPIYDDYLVMLEAEAEHLDWMCLPTGIAWHTEMTLESLRRGLHVLVEKPLAPTLQEVAQIQAAEKESGLVVAVGYQHSYLRGTWEIKRRLLAGELGKIQRLDGICLWPRGISYYQRNEWGGRLHDGHGWVLDSPLQNAVSHLVNLILLFAGETLIDRAEIEAITAEIYRAKPIESYDTVRTTAKLHTGAEASIILSHSSTQTIDPEIRIVGTQGTLIWRFSGAHTFMRDGQIDILRTRGAIPTREYMFEIVARRILGDTRMRVCTTEMAKGEVKWVNAVHDAATIQDIPSAYRQQIVPQNGDVLDTILDLEYYALRAFHERKSFEAVGAPWAVPPARSDVTDYAAFRGDNIVLPEAAAATG